ncbi:aspartate aminotransferase family protein, partial [bacterium]
SPQAAEGDVNLAPARQRWQAANLDEATRRMLAEDKAAFLHQSLSTPCLNAIARAEGAWIEDLQGRRYLDFHGNSAHQVGYGHPRVIEAIKAGLDTLPFCPRRYTNRPAIELAQRLGELAPGRLNKVLFAPGGSAAIGIALKLARVATGRFKTVSMWDSFHGASLDAISVGGEGQFRQGIGPLLPGTEHVPPPDPRRCPLKCGDRCSMACASYLSYVLEREGDVAAVVAEPLRCTTAVQPPADYWPRVREACGRHGALLIFDEIPVGLGRTGTMFATELTGVTPDILVLGKGLGGGVFPMAAIVAHEDLDVAGTVSLGHYTHEKSPVGAAASLATLDVIRDERLVERSRELGSWFLSRLRKVAERHPSVLEVRGIGLLIGVEMRSASVAEATMYEALTRGLSFKVSAGTVLTLTPPLTISETELEFALGVLDAALGIAEREER